MIDCKVSKEKVMNKKSREEIKLMRMAGNIVALVHQEMKKVIEPGISTLELDKIAYDIIKKNKAIPTFLGYSGFPNSICASLNEEVGRGLNNFGITTVQGYGLTETSPVLAAERPWDLCAGSVGLPMRSVKIVIDSPDENGIGEIVVWGPNVMHGYYQQPEATDEVIKNGWFYTGDLGRLDEKGRLWICGRKKNVIVMKNGKNIFPEELETLIGDLPYVAENMIFTREKHNELVIWVKIVYNPSYLEAEGLTKEAFVAQVKKDLAAINDTLPSYKYVNHFILSEEPMIMTTTMKVKRNLEIKAIDEKWDETEQYNVTK